MPHSEKRLAWAAGMATVLLTACQTLTPPPPPEGSVLPGNLTKIEPDRDYFLDHGYVRDALAYGNQGFQEILAHNDELARQSFVQSTELLAAGLVEHKKFAESRAQIQRSFADIFKAGLMALGTVAAYKAGSSATTTQQRQAVDSAFSSFLDASNNLGAFIQDQIRRGELESSAVRSIDKNKWRAVVVADHRIARSIVRVRNQSTGGSCTGFFIAPHVIMTAAHCFNLGQTLAAYRQIPADGEAFMTGEDEFIEIERQYQDKGFVYGDMSTTPYDIAFLVTKKPSQSYLPISTRPLARGDRLMALGYSGDLNKGHFLRIDYGCKVTSLRKADQFVGDCATYKGNSGGPVLTIDKEIAVVGVFSAGFFRRDRSNDDSIYAPARRGAAIFHSVMNDPESSGRVTFNPFD